MPSFRIERINRELLKKIADILRVRIKNDDVQRAMLTQVDCSKDLGHAKVYFITMSSEEKSQKVLKALEDMAGVVRGILGKEMQLRRIPELHFIYDRTEEKARAMENYLDALIASGDIVK